MKKKAKENKLLKSKKTKEREQENAKLEKELSEQEKQMGGKKKLMAK